MKVLSLVNTEAHVMLSLVQHIFGSDVKIAVDPRTNSLIAAGPESRLAEMEALLMRLDETADRNLRAKSYRLRIVWFAQQPTGDEVVVSDDELLPVAGALTKLGIKTIHQMGQTAVQVITGSPFHITSSAALGDGPAEVKIKGVLDVQETTPHLQIEIAAEREEAVEFGGDRAPNGTRLVDLSTHIVAPVGHCVVLGVTPARGSTLAFVVQIQGED
jgi:hypothetical protein